MPSKLFKRTQNIEILSLHTPQTTDTIGMVNDSFIDFKNPFGY